MKSWKWRDHKDWDGEIQVGEVGDPATKTRDAREVVSASAVFDFETRDPDYYP